MLKSFINSISRFECPCDSCGHTEISKVLPKKWLFSLLLAYLSLLMRLRPLRTFQIPSNLLCISSHQSQAVSSWLWDTVLVSDSGTLDLGFDLVCLMFEFMMPQKGWFYMTLWFSEPLAESVRNFCPVEIAPFLTPWATAIRPSYMQEWSRSKEWV